jgi:RNA polymerase sigma-70 factor (ECF subfamily)
MPNNRSEIDMIPPLAACADGVLIQMAIDGHNDCFSVLMDRHLVALKRRLRPMVSNEADLDDLVQEVLLKTWLHLATFRSESNLRTWMIRIGINQARQSYRMTQCRPVCQPLDEFAGIASPGESPHQRLLRDETTNAVRGAVARLPAKYREVLVLHDLTELCDKETAERLQTTIKAVKARLFRARGMLSTKLRRSGVPGCDKGQRRIETSLRTSAEQHSGETCECKVA